MKINKLLKIFFKINIIRFVFQTIKYRIRIGNYVNFENNGIIKFITSNITIRDFSDIVVVKNGQLIISDNVFLGKNVEIGAENIFIDKNTSIQNNCILLGNISIGKNCSFGPSIYVSSGFHYFKYRPELLIKDQDIIAIDEVDTSQNKIVIEDDIWIGKNVVIINNVTISKGAIINANSFINKDVEPYTIVAGSPHRVIGLRLDFKKNIPNFLNGSHEKDFPYFYTGFDYSLKALKINSFVRIVENQFSFYLKNTHNQKYITIELISMEENNSLLVYHNKSNKISLGEQQFKFLIQPEFTDKFKFIIDGDLGKILVKKIYFND